LRSEFLFYLAQLCLIVTLSLLIDPNVVNIASARSAQHLASSVISLILAALVCKSIIDELVQLLRDRKRYFRRRLKKRSIFPCWAWNGREYFFDFWNWVHIVQIALTLGFVATYLAGNHHYRWQLALLAYTKWFGILFYLQAFSSTSPLVRTILAIFLRIRWFIIILAICILALSNTFYVLLHRDPLSSTSLFTSVPLTIIDTLIILLFNNNYMPSMGFKTGHYIELNYGVYILAQFFVLIVLLNILIAIMNNEYGKIQDRADVEFLRLRAGIILEVQLEKDFPLKCNWLTYAVPSDDNSNGDDNASSGMPDGVKELKETEDAHFAAMSQAIKRHDRALEGTRSTIRTQEVQLADIKDLLTGKEGASSPSSSSSSPSADARIAAMSKEMNSIKTMLQEQQALLLKLVSQSAPIDLHTNA